MTLDELRAAKGDTILAIARRHGVTDIKVFGSFARGEARDDSDLDLLIEAGGTRPHFFRAAWRRTWKKLSAGTSMLWKNRGFTGYGAPRFSGKRCLFRKATSYNNAYPLS